MTTVGFSMRRIEPFLDVTRANFLLLSVVIVALGAAAAHVTGPVDPIRTGLALVGLVSLHISVNAINEYSDYRRGIDFETEKTPFSGGSGVLPAGRLDPDVALRIGLVTAAIGAVIGAYFLWVVGLALVPIIVLGAICVLLYTDLLARIGLGEIAAGLGLGALPVIGVALVQDGTVGLPAFVAAVPAFFLTFNLLLLNEFPDIEPDRRGGRTNLIHLLGRHRAAMLYIGVGLAVPVTIVIAVVAEVLPGLALVGVVPSIFLARQIRWGITHPGTSLPIEAQRDNVIWILLTYALLAAGVAFPAVAFATDVGMTLNEGVFLLARLLFGFVLFFMAFNNIADLDNIADQIAETGMPLPKIATVVASVPLLLAALSIATGVYPVYGAAYIVVFMVFSTVIVHNFLGMEDEDEQENEIFHFLKNLLILAGALLFLSIGLGGSEWPYAL